MADNLPGDEPDDAGPEVPKLAPTAWAVLGFLSLKSLTGYEVLRAAKQSTEAFWAVNNGQLYPQLKHLSELGLIRPAGAPEGPRSRQRWEITDAGRTAFASWLSALSAPVQIRDENLAKLFFAARTDPHAARRLLEERRQVSQWLEQTMDTLLPGDELPPAEQTTPLGAPELLFRYGKHFTKATLHWIDQEEERLFPDLVADDADGSAGADGTDQDGKKP